MQKALTQRTGYKANPLAHLPEDQRGQIADEILARYEAGEQIAALCGDYSCGPVTVYALLWKLRESAWIEAQTSRAMARHAQALTELDAVKAGLEGAAGENAALEISRQRELLKVAEARVKSAQWELEKLLRRVYGVDAPTIRVNVNLSDVAARISELEAELGVTVIETGDESSDT
jgi:hypothetical protein